MIIRFSLGFLIAMSGLVSSCFHPDDDGEEVFPTSSSLIQAQALSAVPGGTIEHPRDMNQDGVVTLCMRQSYVDCDYPVVQGMEVRMPLKGAVVLPAPVSQIHNDSGTYVRLISYTGGGQMAVSNFSSWLRIDPSDNRRIIWDVPQSQVLFTGSLFAPREQVIMLIGIRVTILRAGRHVQTQIAMSSNSNGASGAPVLSKVSLAYERATQYALLLIDSSSYMSILRTDGAPRFTEAIRRARMVVGTPSTQLRSFAVWTFSGTSYKEVQGFADGPTTLTTLDGLQVQEGLPPLAHALCASADALMAHNPGVDADRFLYLFSAGEERRSPPRSQCHGPESADIAPDFTQDSWQWKVRNKLDTGDAQVSRVGGAAPRVVGVDVFTNAIR